MKFMFILVSKNLHLEFFLMHVTLRNKPKNVFKIAQHPNLLIH